MRLPDLVVAVARLVFATDPALATLLATSPSATFDTNVRVVKRAIAMNGGHVTAKVVLAREGASTGRMRARMGLGPVGVVGFPVRLEIKGASEGSRTIRALILLLRVLGNQFDLFVVHAGNVWFGRGGRRGDGTRRGKGRLPANDRALTLYTGGGGVLRHGCQHGGHD